MKKRIACAFVITLLYLSLSPLYRVTAQQDGKPSTPNAEAAKATSNNTPAPVKTSAAEKTSESSADEVKAPRVARPDDKIVLGTGVVNVIVSVTDPYGRFVTGLGKDHFDVFDDKVKQQIAHFTDEDAPVSLGIVYDVSGSMKERIARSVKALRRFIETSHDDDDFFLIGFNDRAKLVQDFTPSGDQVLGHLMFVQPKGSTALYDAAYLAVEKVQQGRHSKKALLIISDGQDNNSRYTYKELRNRVKEADVQIYAIGITDPATDSLAGFGRGVLEEITRMTGGRVFFPNAYNEPELVEICTRIALELRHQYSIGFYPTDLTSEAKWHKVQVKVNPPRGLGRLSLTYRDGYQSFKK
ncbi:MAG TPA: VWA domain-containing protein [Blastocatellia bacterium]|jgi:Ca-activated chloride channel family protein|nr:VWA domain-containing protein [Blastocatellia bacterium]